MEEISFEQALKELEGIVDKLEKGESGLEESLKLYDEGAKLAEICRQKLSKVEHRLKELVKTGTDVFEPKETSLGED